MNEPSDGAKQFAEQWGEEEGWPDSSDIAGMARRYDAATAKLRAENDGIVIKQGAAIEAQNAIIAKLRAENERLTKELHVAIVALSAEAAQQQ